MGTYGNEAGGNDSNKEFWVINAVDTGPSLSASASVSVGNSTLSAGGLSFKADALRSDIKLSSGSRGTKSSAKSSKKTIKKVTKKAATKPSAKKSAKSTSKGKASRDVHHADIARSIEERAAKEPAYFTMSVVI